MSCILKLTCLLAALWMPVALAQTATTPANIVHQRSTSAAPAPAAACCTAASHKR